MTVLVAEREETNEVVRRMIAAALREAMQAGISVPELLEGIVQTDASSEDAAIDEKPRRVSRSTRTAHVCQREGCENELTRTGQKFCSYACRNIALHDVYSERAKERQEKLAKSRTFNTSPALREAFRLSYEKVSADLWPDEVRAAYHTYIAEQRAKRRAKREEQQPPQQQQQRGTHKVAGTAATTFIASRSPQRRASGDDALPNLYGGGDLTILPLIMAASTLAAVTQ